MSVGDDTIRSAGFATSASDPLLHTIVGDYRVEAVLGSGAMGIVYRVVHVVIGKPAALKVLKPDFADDPEMVARLVREARTVNAIRHPGIVDIFGFGNLPTGQPFIVMDLLEGEPLDAFIRREAPMRVKVAQPVVDELLSALWAAHNVGVIHRDLKPQNIFLERHVDRAPSVKLLDFGLARQADRAGGSIRPTNPGTLLGTPAFMAPEQVMGERVTPATDLYAVGGILYQMLTGHLPHEGPSALEVLSQKMHHQPLSVRKWAPQVSEELDALILSLLRRDEPERPQSADEVRKRLRALAEQRQSGPKAAPSPSTKPSGSSGVVPKRAWQEARTVLVDGASDGEPPHSSQDRPAQPTEPSLFATAEAPHATPEPPRTLPAFAALPPDGSPPRPWELKTARQFALEDPPPPQPAPAGLGDDTLPPTAGRPELAANPNRLIITAAIATAVLLVLALAIAGLAFFGGP